VLNHYTMWTIWAYIALFVYATIANKKDDTILEFLVPTIVLVLSNFSAFVHSKDDPSFKNQTNQMGVLQI
jgi:hypothetical protein